MTENVIVNVLPEYIEGTTWIPRITKYMYQNKIVIIDESLVTAAMSSFVYEHQIGLSGIHGLDIRLHSVTLNYLFYFM